MIRPIRPNIYKVMGFKFTKGCLALGYAKFCRDLYNKRIGVEIEKESK